MKLKYFLPVGILTLAGVVLLLAAAPKAKAKPETATQTQLQRGEYLVKFGDCGACHTPLKFGPNGPEPDMAAFCPVTRKTPNSRRRT